ncbi:MAG: phosphonate C-P lyase system protein PhnH [Sporolactobacillus sp.]
MTHIKFDNVQDTRRLYRKLLDCMARPGKVQDVSEQLQMIPTDLPCSQGIFAIAQTLLDQQVGFYLSSDEAHQREAVRYLEWTTGSRFKGIAEADYLFFERQSPAQQIRSALSEARIGSFLEPEKSTTLIFIIRGVSSSEKYPLHLTLSGPGICQSRELFIDGLAAEWLRQRAARNREYPQGYDWILLSEDGEMTAIPRTTAIESEVLSWDM